MSDAWTTMVLESSAIKLAEGRYPSQIVLRQVKAKTYATHMKVHPPGDEPYFILGRYFFNLDEAIVDFNHRSRELEEAPMSGPAE